MGFFVVLRVCDLDVVIFEFLVMCIVLFLDVLCDYKVLDVIFILCYGVEYGFQGCGVVWCVGDKIVEVVVVKGWDVLFVGGDVEVLFKWICVDFEGKVEG